jgi:hypothetical protein
MSRPTTLVVNIDSSVNRLNNLTIITPESPNDSSSNEAKQDNELCKHDKIARFKNANWLATLYQAYPKANNRQPIFTKQQQED